MVPFEKLAALLAKQPNKLVFSRPLHEDLPRNLVLQKIQKGKAPYQAVRQFEKKVFHTPVWDLVAYVREALPLWRELHVFGEEDYSALLSKGNVVSLKKLPKQSKAVAVAHNREKNRLIAEGDDLPIFVKLGIFTKEGKVVAAKQEKFRQINRYLELLMDVLKEYKPGDSLRVADYGCGKSYLSFAVYYYLTVKRGLKVDLVGVDLKEDVMEECNRLAQEYGYEGMHFVCANIRDYKPEAPIDLVISLHACDVATDYVLDGAIRQGVKHIFAAPCCQHELAKTLDGALMPMMMRHGIVRERLAALATDSLRVAVLETHDYSVDIVEFVDLADSPKNLLIRAVKHKQSVGFKQARQAEIDSLVALCGKKPTLLRLLEE